MSLAWVGWAQAWIDVGCVESGAPGRVFARILHLRFRDRRKTGTSAEKYGLSSFQLLRTRYDRSRP
jgi:hypothetical protein